MNSRTGAIGIGQILPSNVGPWSQKYLGQRITPSQLRSSPALQDQLTRAVLSDYYNRYGARGAASAWYSGNPASANNYTRFRSNEPSIGEYVDSVLGKMGGDFPPLPPTNTTVRTSSPGTISVSPQSLQQPGFTSPLGLEAADGTQQAGVDVLSAADGTVRSQSLEQKPPQSPAEVDASPATSPAIPQHQPTGAGMSQAVIDMGEKYLGVPYVWGGTSPNGLDCSGLVQRAFAEMGVTLPRVSYDQLKMGPRIGTDQLKPGDLVGWGSNTSDPGHHVALYIGNGQILEAPRTGLNVRIRTLGDSYDRSQGIFGVSMAQYLGR